MRSGDLVWCVYDFYKLPEPAVILKVHELNPIYKTVDLHYEVLINSDIYTLHEYEVFATEDEALEYQIMQVKGYNKF